MVTGDRSFLLQGPFSAPHDGPAMPSTSLKCLLAVVGKGGTPAVDAPSLASQASSPPSLPSPPSAHTPRELRQAWASGSPSRLSPPLALTAAHRPSTCVQLPSWYQHVKLHGRLRLNTAEAESVSLG